MTESARSRAPITALILLAAGVFLAGINWGLPSRWVDSYLFGDEPVWSGAKILALAPSDEGTLGADVDANPLAKQSYPVALNDTDEKRAEIIRRYRLFSHQPDEMITFKSLARIKQHKGDPRLYQYGGLWMYPVGALLKLADLAGFVELRGGPEGQAYYLDNPEAFGRFYIVARLYTVIWGLVGVWAVFWIVHRMTGSNLAAAAGALCYTFMPVVVNMAHEAKPHLPAAVLMLLSAMAASKYVETGKARWWVAAGALCGAAFGMVLSSLVGFAVIPVMALLRPDRWARRLGVVLGAAMIGLAVYAVANPYVVINAVVAPEILRANLSNSTAMYGKRGVAGLGNAFTLLAAGASPLVLFGGVIGLLSLIVPRTRFWALAALLAAPATLVLVQFALLAEGKPGEYARFAIFPAIVFAIAGPAWLLEHPGYARGVRLFAVIAIVMGTVVYGVPYVLGFVADAGTSNSRRLTAEAMARDDGGAVSLVAEPAPYSAPPLNLFNRKVLLVDPASPTDGTLRAVDGNPLRLFNTPISWANKRFVVLREKVDPVK